MKFKSFLLIQCIILWFCIPLISFSQSIQTGSWSTSNGDVKFYVSQQSELDTLSIKLTFTGSCSGSIIMSAQSVSITNRSFSLNIGSSVDGSAGTIIGDFSVDGKSCNGTYTYNKAPCDPINVTWTATPTGAPPLETDNVHIVDENFLNGLIEEGVDANGDGLISYAEAEAISYLDFSGSYSERGNIADMTGIEAFVNLEYLDCSYNKLSALDVSNNTLLTDLDCFANKLSALDVSNNTLLTDLNCGANELTALDITKNILLTDLGCGVNELTTLDITKNILLTDLSCPWNELTALDLSLLPDLRDVWCGSNQISSLDVSNYKLLERLRCEKNLLTSLDVSKNSALEGLECGGNLLTSLNLSNNSNLATKYWLSKDLGINSMPTLTQVCVWETFISDSVNMYIDTVGSPNVYFTTECAVGVQEQSFSELSIYPNPTNNFLTIETEQPDHYSINITSLNGQLIYSTIMEGTTHQIDLSSFQKGIYFITIRSDEFVTTRKIIKL